MGRANLFSALLPAWAVDVRLPETSAPAISHRFSPGGSALDVEPPDTLAAGRCSVLNVLCRTDEEF